MQRILEARRPGAAVRVLTGQGLLRALDEELRCLRGAATSLDRLPGVVRRHGRHSPDEPLLVWTIALPLLLRASPGHVVARALDRLQPSRAERAAVTGGLAALSSLPRRLGRGRLLRPSTVDAACAGRATEALLSVLVASSSPGVRGALLRYLRTLRHVRLEISGKDLLASGLPPGPAVARGLEAARKARLDGRATRLGDQLRAALAAAARS